MLYSNICTVIIAVGSIELLLRLLAIGYWFSLFLFSYFLIVVFHLTIRPKIQHDFYSLSFMLLSENSFLSRYLVTIKTY